MEIKIKPLHGNPAVRCSIHANGRLTFSFAAIDELGLKRDQSISIGCNADNANDKSLYMCCYKEYKKDAFFINSSGSYLYLNTGMLFRRLGYDFKNRLITFDIIGVENNGDVKLFRLEKSEIFR